MSHEQLKALPRDELQRALAARAEARRTSLRGRITHGIALAFLALGCVAAAASLLVKDHMGINPLLAAGFLLAAPFAARALLGRRPQRLG